MQLIGARAPARGCTRRPQITQIRQSASGQLIINPQSEICDYIGHDPGRHQRLQLSGMEGQLLSGGSAAAKMLPYYASKFPHRRDQLHLLPHADAEARGRLGGAGAAGVPVHAEGAEAHHPRQAAARRRGRRVAAAASSPRPASWARSWARCCSSCRRTSRRTSALLNEFLSLLPPKTTAAFEFRHESWLDDEVYDALRARNIALCIADSETRETPVDDDGRLRLLAAARRGLRRRRHRASGPRPRSSWRDVRATCSCISSTKTKGKGAAFGQQMMEFLGQTT